VAGGDVTITASSAPLINATVSNTAASQNLGLFGVSSAAAGAVLASNRVSSGARAAIEFSTPGGAVVAGGDVVVEAVNDAGIYANAKLVVSSITTNDGGVHLVQAGVNAAIDADHDSSDGPTAIEFGRRVRLAASFGVPAATAGTIGTQLM